MAKKSTLKKKKIKKVKKISPKIKHLETLLFYTERNITNRGDSVDEFFKGQAEQIRKEIEKERENA